MTTSEIWRQIERGEASLLSDAALARCLWGEPTADAPAAFEEEERPLSQWTWRELTALPGVGPAKAARLMAAVELGRRAATRPWSPGEAFRGARQVYEHFGPRLRGARREHFLAVLLDVRRRLIHSSTISIGSLVASLVHPREVFRRAIQHAAAGVLVVHNHPSGDPQPSPEDWAVTDRLREAGQILGIELVDHVVLGEGSWVSLRERSPVRWGEGADPGPAIADPPPEGGDNAVPPRSGGLLSAGGGKGPPFPF